MSPFGDGQTRSTPAPVLKVTIQRGATGRKEFTFTEPFSIGREQPCEIVLEDRSVSRRHAEVYLREGCWWIRDLNSSNGTYVDGRPIDRLPLTRPTLIEFGSAGTMLFFEEQEVQGREGTFVHRPASVTQYVKHYFGRSPVENMGQQTMFLREAFLRVQRKQKSKYLMVIAVIGAGLLLTAGYAVVQQKKFRELRQQAIDNFYVSKKTELAIADMRARLIEAGKVEELKDIEKKQADLNKMAENYDSLVDRLGVYKKRMKEDERLILKVARIFGECELNMPVGFVQEVRRYIKMWQNSPKLAAAISLAKANKYEYDIANELRRQRLPIHFFYLALWESGFDTKNVGPPIRVGGQGTFAKGMWMFIPGTARQYGLQVGPLEQYPRYDSQDERHDFKKSTDAAARYIRSIYETDAQASGLLVMASYNWGQNRVIDIIRKMPLNPRERNFWQLLNNRIYFDKIPPQTYDYVFYIFSAAVIGESPGFFNFRFDDPLAGVKKCFPQ